MKVLTDFYANFKQADANVDHILCADFFFNGGS